MFYGTIKCYGCGAVRDIEDIAIFACPIGEIVTIEKLCPVCQSAQGKLLKRTVSLDGPPPSPIWKEGRLLVQVQPVLPEFVITLHDPPDNIPDNIRLMFEQYENDVLDSVRLPVSELMLEDDDQIALLKRMYEKEG